MPIRETFWNIPHWAEIAQYLLGFLTILIFGYGVIRRVRRWLKGHPQRRIDHIGTRLWSVIVQAIGQGGEAGTERLGERGDRPGSHAKGFIPRDHAFHNFLGHDRTVYRHHSSHGRLGCDAFVLQCPVSYRMGVCRV